jgi:hypothetical protein
MTIHARTTATSLIGLIVLALAGCGPGEGAVSGTVKFKGQPLTVGDNTVTFLGEDGSVKSCTVEPDGSYTFRGVHGGRARITVHSLPPPPSLLTAPGEDGQMKPVGGAGQPSKPGQFGGIPDRYKDPDKSELTFDVHRGSQTFDIELSP